MNENICTLKYVKGILPQLSTFLEHNYTISLTKVLNICGKVFILCFFLGNWHIKSPKTVQFNGVFCNDENVLESCCPIR